MALWLTTRLHFLLLSAADAPTTTGNTPGITGVGFQCRAYEFKYLRACTGKVIYTGQMNIRGNTLFIDHGQGVVSGYAHMQEFKVNLGDIVEQGQLIGLIGKAGRVTGPHLHWDIFINGTG